MRYRNFFSELTKVNLCLDITKCEKTVTEIKMEIRIPNAFRLRLN